MTNFPSPPLSNKDRLEVFQLATRGFASRFSDQMLSGMRDAELEAALEGYLGIFGDSGGPNRLSVSYAGSGFRIWGGWHTVNHVKEKPLFKGSLTIAMARETYGISNPDEDQIALL